MIKFSSDVVIAETMEDMDENNDGKISLSEYVGEMDDENEEDDDDGNDFYQQFNLLNI